LFSLANLDTNWTRFGRRLRSAF